MKKLLIFIFLFSIAAFDLQARILTVTNVVGSVAMFRSVQTAVDSAKVGDTVFVHASTTAYSAVVIKRKIVLIGEGGKPDFTGITSQLSSISIDSLSGVPVSGSIVLGFETGSFIVDSKVMGLIIKNCYVTSTTNFLGSGHIVVNNIFSNVITLGSNITFSNNIVTNYNINNGTNCIISNNIILNPNGSSYPAFQLLNNCTIVNNIIVSTLKTTSGGVGSSYSKNIQAGTDLPSGNFTGIQPVNIFNESSISASMTAVQYLTASWKQLSTSVGKNAGTDGKEIGVYGGSFPWPSNKIFNGDPGLPKVSIVVVQNAVIAPNGTLKIDFKAKSASAK